MITTINSAFLSVLNRSVQVIPVKACTSRGVSLLLLPLLKNTTLCARIPFGLHKHSASVDECLCVPFFPHGRNRWHIFASYTLPHQMPFSQTAPLLPSVTWQQHVTKYWWEVSTSTAIPPTSASDIMDQCNKIGGIIFELMYISNGAFYFLIFFIKKGEQQNHNADYLTLFLWKSGLMAVAAIFCERFLMRLSHASSLKTVVHKYTYCQKVVTGTRHDGEARDTSLC